MRTPLILTAAALAGCTQSAEPAPADPYADARAFVTAHLKDPDSARFGPFTAGAGDSVCGWINARNAFGGYTGPRAFVFTPPAELIVDDQAGDWGDRGWTARRFEARGCTIGADHQRALEARRLLDESNARIAASGK